MIWSKLLVSEECYMDNITDMEIKIDKLYDEYQRKGSKLNETQTNEVIMLLGKMTVAPNSNAQLIADQLARFSIKICQSYFNSLASSLKPPIDFIDDILRAFLLTKRGVKTDNFFITKCENIVITIIKNYATKAYSSAQLPKIIEKIADRAVISDCSKSQFQNMINKTEGAIYILDYSTVSPESLNNIWNVTSKIFYNISEAKYESLINDWAVKYGFNITGKSEKPQEKENVTNPNNEHSPQEDNKASASTAKSIAPDSSSQKSLPQEEKTQSIEAVIPNDDKTASAETTKAIPAMNNTTASDKAESKQDNITEIMAKKLYNSIRRDMTNEKNALVSAFADMLTPVSKAFESVQGEISKSRVLGAENVVLKRQTEELKQQLAETRSQLQSANQSLIAEKENNKELKDQITDLENKKSDLDQKLNEAYTINSRESSLEAEKVRSELKKAFAFLYEDWLEYEFSDVSEENYESLQAIIKKTFRALERNGIDFKGEK